jgi:hypothetical protein
MLREGRTAGAAGGAVGGTRCPISMSAKGAADADPPVFAMRSSSSSVESVQSM